jgi:exosortase/archaeosortase family protein
VKGQEGRVGGSAIPPVLFVVTLAAGSLLLSVRQVEKTLVAPWTRAIAGAAVGLVKVAGGEADLTGTVIDFGPASTNIMNGCNGVHAVLILSAAFLASPIGLVRRLLGACFGAVMLFALNIVRIAVLVSVGKQSPNAMEWFHVYVLQTFVILGAFSIYLFWMRRFGSEA